MSFVENLSSQSPPTPVAAAAVPAAAPAPVPVKKSSRDEGNFRSHYYGKVGFKGVDDRKTLELLLSEDPINVYRCAHFAFKCSVPGERRLTLWKALLHVTAWYPNNSDYVWKWRVKPYHDVVRALKVMEKVDDKWPKAKNLTVVYLLFSKKLKLDVDKQLREPDSLNFMAVAETMLELTDGEEIEAFYLAKGFFETLDKYLSDEFLLKELELMYHKILTNTNGNLYSHLDKIGLNDAIPIRTWLCRGFAGILHPSGLGKIWDKLLGGSVSLLIYVAVALVDTSKVALLGCQTTREAMRCLVSTSEEMDEMISQHAIDLWKADGSLLIPADASRAAKERQRHASGNRQAASTSVPSSNNADEVEAAVQQLKAAEIKIKLDC